MSDYEIDQIRRIRHQISADNGHDLRKVAEYYRAVENELRATGRFKFADERQAKPIEESTIAKAG